MHALEAAVEIGRHFGAAILLVHVNPLIGEGVPISLKPYLESEKAALAKLHQIANEKLHGVP